MGPPGTAAGRAAGAQFGSAAPREVEPGAGTSPLPLAELKGLLSVGAVPAARLHAPGPPGATHPLQGFPGLNAAPVAPRISPQCAPPEPRPAPAPLGSAVPRVPAPSPCPQPVPPGAGNPENAQRKRRGDRGTETVRDQGKEAQRETQTSLGATKVQGTGMGVGNLASPSPRGPLSGRAGLVGVASRRTQPATVHWSPTHLSEAATVVGWCLLLWTSPTSELAAPASCGHTDAQHTCSLLGKSECIACFRSPFLFLRVPLHPPARRRGPGPLPLESQAVGGTEKCGIMG
ncbi:cyclin-dependent kinase inhibitor 1C-like [Phyllostomus hastatus]|uniref:cyclin-dependent kinase inhibitor 1C-like n=1 Tax=Phyllostomus hastatus TaxID=9423 RepID=UPI001E680E76|nr:cyclin-dependent kinase inhibitor 1C-like [Phyllostomus hastatus]